MHLKTGSDELAEKKTVKLQISKGQLVRLKSEKILTGETISDIAGVALARYFEDEAPDEEANA